MPRTKKIIDDTSLLGFKKILIGFEIRKTKIQKMFGNTPKYPK